MNIYSYDSSSINEYSQEDCGLVSTSCEVEDYGNLSDCAEQKEDFYYVDCNETLYPFGSVIIKGSSKHRHRTSVFKKALDLNLNSIVFYGIIIRWMGYSVMFQMSNSLERIVIPDVSGGGK